MNLHAANAFLLRDRSDWRKPHLSWLPSSLYRYYSHSRLLLKK
ncbi:hypothetical protein ACFORG_09700 [Lutimaribacter marinistellae]|uniref:Uncharacterized protein n=1 Tax=Lutimaribacter marinistellae TaxID=1820329 RepID=A0ABV7TFD3_9RHOB